MAVRVPYDGTGRYTMDQGDDVRRIQGLTELAGRFGVKPYEELHTRPYDGTWQSERVVFHDLGTTATIVRLTNDPWADSLSYFKGNWSADGQYVVFRRQPGMWESSTDDHGPMAVRSDGTSLRNVFRDYHGARSEVCSPTEPNICYAMADGNRLVAFDLRTGKTHHVVRQVPGCWHLKISPDGKYLMSRCMEEGHRVLWIVSGDGREYHEIPVPEAIHDSYQFHPSQEKIMFGYERNHGAEGFVQCDFDGRNMTKVPVQFDWNHGDVGLDRGVHTDGYITRIKGDTWLAKEPLFHRPGVEYYDDPIHYNGYLTWMPTDRPWVYATRIPLQPRLSEIQAFSVEPVVDDVVNRFRICYTCMQKGKALDCPGASPDGTKVLFNSNMLGSVDVYYVAARLTERPTGLQAERGVNGIKLTWEAPAHHAEISGYNVYRGTQSGIELEPVSRRPITSREVLDNTIPADATMFYAVTAVEHSGLESGLSDEAAVGNTAGIKRHIFVAADEAECNPKMCRAFDGRASNLHYLWMRAHEGEGRAALTVNLSEINGPCDVWARVKGPQGTRFVLTTENKSISLVAPAAEQWIWAKFDGKLSVKPGKCAVALSSSTYGSAVDCLSFTDDAGFSPARQPRIAWPQPAVVQNIKAEAASPYAVKLAWRYIENHTFHHYNLYCGHNAEFTPDQTTLIASSDRKTYCDWRLKPGQTLYYRLTAVDRAGHESVPSEPVKVALPKLERVVVRKDPGESVEFNVPKHDTYVVWLKLQRASDAGGAYVNVKFDGGPVATWTVAFDGLSDLSWFTYDQWGRFLLTAGPHRLTIENKTKHAMVSVLLTNDLSFQPEGHVNILSGW